MENIINQYYETYNFPNIDKLYKLLKEDGHKVNKSDIKEFLSKQKEHQQFKEIRTTKKKQGYITAMTPNEIWMLDIFYMMKYYKQNHGYKYIIACVDVFTRKAYAAATKTKDISEVLKAIEQLFKNADATPQILTSDSDSTFLSNEAQNFFMKHEIKHLTVPVGDHKGLGVIDRFARTLKTVLHKRFIYHDTTNWYDVLPKILNQYNNSPHSSIDDIKPNKATEPDNIATIAKINYAKRKGLTSYDNKAFKEGDKVRIKTGGFNKKTEGQFGDEVYIVKSVNGKSITLNDGKVKKYDMLSKVHKDTPIEEPKKKYEIPTNAIKKAKQEYKQEKVLKKEDIKDENVRESRTRGIRKDYSIYK